MRLLGFVFILVLILAIVGYFRGWFSVTTTHASGKDEVTVGVDNDKIGADTKAAARGLGRLSQKAVAAVKSLGKKTSANETELLGTIDSAAPAGRDLTLAVGTEKIEVHVPTTVPITKDGKAADFAVLQPGTRAKLFFEQQGEDQDLVRVEAVD